MSRRRQVEKHRRRLGEIRDIMNSMKSLAYMETRKLSRFVETQRAVVKAIHRVADDFLGFHPGLLPPMPGGEALCLVIGSERGFCGDFNEQLLRHAAGCPGAGAPLILVGTKLHGLVAPGRPVLAKLAGADVVEDVEAVLNRIIDVLTAHYEARGPGPLSVVYQGAEAEGVLQERLLPAFGGDDRPAAAFAHPPVLNVPPEDFFRDLADHYLLAAVHGILLSSLMAENHRRVRHLEGAVRHLDDKTVALARRANVLRQEEIIEEIEVILLSAETLTAESAPMLHEGFGNQGVMGKAGGTIGR